MSANSFTILGCAANRQVTGEDNNVTSGYVLRVGERLILFDCGGGVTGAFLRAKFDFTEVGEIFVSHTHPDHVTDLPLFLQSIYLTWRKNPLHLFLPDDFVGPFESYMRALYMFPETYPFEFHVTGYRGEFVHHGEGFTVRAIPNAHLSHYGERIAKFGRTNEMLSSSFLIEVDSARPGSHPHKLFYSADLASFDEIKEHVDGCSYVLVDSTHIEVDDVLSYAKDADIGALIFTHLGDDNEIAHLREKITRSGLDRATLAEPGLTLAL